MPQTVVDIQQRLAQVDRAEFEVLERQLRADTRKGVQRALAVTRRRLEAAEAEAARIAALYKEQDVLSGGGLAVGLDEVGRGPLAGPLTVGAVVLDPSAPRIAGLNDSKQVPESHRPVLADAVKASSLAWAIVNIEPDRIDKEGMASCLRTAFSEALSQIETQGVQPDVVLLDGNPLHIDPREINVVHGDARVAVISAASLIAKVSRDAEMVAYDAIYPGYDFASSKGYGSECHRCAIAEHGLTPIHRTTFCRGIVQETLF